MAADRAVIEVEHSVEGLRSAEVTEAGFFGCGLMRTACILAAAPAPKQQKVAAQDGTWLPEAANCCRWYLGQ